MAPQTHTASDHPNLYSFSAKSASGQTVNLSQYEGKVLLIVNVASQCGFTPQYQGLQALHEEFHDQGLEILAFPCNQFGAQEPGTEQEIQSFCEMNYGVKFPLFAKIEVNGAGTHPLYAYLKTQGKGILGTEAIKWNFTKFLVDRTGRHIERYAPNTTPESLRSEILALLQPHH